MCVCVCVGGGGGDLLPLHKPESSIVKAVCLALCKCQQVTRYTQGRWPLWWDGQATQTNSPFSQPPAQG